MHNNRFRSKNQRGAGLARVLPLAAAAALVAPAAAQPTQETIRIGRTPGGSPIEVIAIGQTGRDANGLTRDQRPAVLVVAGVQGHHVIGSEIARAVADSAAQRYADLLDSRALYVLPLANPEGRDRYTDDGEPMAQAGRAPERIDFDGDGRFNEDGPDDLNGDGVITMMRVPVPGDAASRFDLEATHLVDPDEPRLMIEPEPGKTGPATHAVLVEGLDNDGDGAFNEDGWGGASGGGIDIDRNFSTHWPELEDGAGRYPFERHEARLLVDWMLTRPNIQQVLVYGPHDTLGKVPETGKYGPAGRVPTGLEPDDKPHHEDVAEAFADITGVTGGGFGDRGGSFVQWAYSEFGVLSYSTPVWYRPDLVSADGGNAKPASSDDAGWLAYIDDHLDGDGFVAWTETDHPQLGTVEVGGFEPGVRVNPRPDATDTRQALAEQQGAFVGDLLERLPALEVHTPTVTMVGPSLYRVAVEAHNHGGLPTATAIGEKSRRLHPLTMVLDPDQILPRDALLDSNRIQRASAIPAGGATRAEWLISAKAGTQLKLEVRSQRFGSRTFTIRLGDN